MRRVDEAKKITIISISTNLILAFLKILSGVVGKSSVIIVDGIDSASDSLSTIIAFLGVRISEKEEDHNHQYGHERFEAVFAKILSVVFLVVSIIVFYNSFLDIKNEKYTVPTIFPLVVSVISIVSKIVLSRYVLGVARSINSFIFEADAKNFINDALSSFFSLVAIYLSQIGYPIFQPIFSFIIGLFIFRLAISLYKNSVDELTDSVASKELVEKIYNEVLKIEGVVRIDDLKTRKHGSKVFVDIEISIPKDFSFIKAHDITEFVHDRVESIDKTIKHCMVHANPH